MSAIDCPATSSMTIIFESWVSVSCSNLVVAQKPMVVVRSVKATKACIPKSANMSKANGNVPRLPIVPGAFGDRPQPNQVASRICGFLRSFTVIMILA